MLEALSCKYGRKYATKRERKGKNEKAAKEKIIESCFALLQARWQLTQMPTAREKDQRSPSSVLLKPHRRQVRSALIAHIAVVG
jgi:hypothetical protein